MTKPSLDLERRGVSEISMRQLPPEGLDRRDFLGTRSGISRRQECPAQHQNNPHLARKTFHLRRQEEGGQANVACDTSYRLVNAASTRYADADLYGSKRCLAISMFPTLLCFILATMSAFQPLFHIVTWAFPHSSCSSPVKRHDSSTKAHKTLDNAFPYGNAPST